MNKEINQTLHGYSNGHHLLSSSIKLSKSSSRIMSVLSDLSGSEVSNNYLSYYTGYPLNEEWCYAIAKTWYASEMKRPGCVWTHTLLINFEDIKYFSNYSLLEELFQRPMDNNSFEQYSKKISVNDNSITYSDYDFLDNDSLAIVLFSYYFNNKPAIFKTFTGNHFIREIWAFLVNQNKSVYSNFSFCTASLSNRKIDNKPFSIQAVPERLVKHILRADKNLYEVQINDALSFMDLIPNWKSQYFTGDNNFFTFINEFNLKSKNSGFKLYDLYNKIFLNRNINSIELYKEILSIFGNEAGGEFVIYLIQKVYEGSVAHWLSKDTIESMLKSICTDRNIEDYNYSIDTIKNIIEDLFINKIEKCRTIFRDLISSELNRIGEKILVHFAKIVTVEKLSTFSEYDIGICNVLVSLNNDLIFDKKLWQKGKDFQIEILNCVNADEMNYDKKLKYIHNIIVNSNETLDSAVFDLFGSDSVPIVLKIITDNSAQNKISWINICKQDHDITLNWIKNQNTIQLPVFLKIIESLDPYSSTILESGIEPWVNNLEEIDDYSLTIEEKRKLSYFFFPIIISNSYIVSNKLLRICFFPVYEEIKKNRYDYNLWRKIEHHLPEMPIYSWWDKCKRLRIAMDRKGYNNLFW